MLTPAAIQTHLDSLTKPPGSLGRLEALAARLCRIQGTLTPSASPRRLVLFAGDHGVVAEGVTAWPSEVTGLMVANIHSGGAASSVLARSSGTALELVDAGTLAPAQAGDGANGQTYLHAPIRGGSRNLAAEPALTPDEWQAAWTLGQQRARAAAKAGARVVAAGEMGIGNTTPASCLAALLTDLTPEQAVGRGAGADDATLERKRRVVAAAVAAASEHLDGDPVAAMASVAGYEIVAMAGFFQSAAERGLTVVLDGFITTAAALIAERLAAGTADAMIAAHLSQEPAHGAMLEALGLKPMLDWDLRLGEGTGALLLMPLLDAAAAMVGEMATFESTGIERDDSGDDSSEAG
ncbi:MAG: nicotinate-nucleotide--dimethylbenzimidazole phosphoribosyltransferase [Acidobacteriota bacterium]